MACKVTWIVGATILTLVNLRTLAMNLSIKARAEVAGVDARQLENDQDFYAAVEDIAATAAKRVVEECHVVDNGNISC
jgi:hypothetical protein